MSTTEHTPILSFRSAVLAIKAATSLLKSSRDDTPTAKSKPVHSLRVTAIALVAACTLQKAVSSGTHTTTPSCAQEHLHPAVEITTAGNGSMPWKNVKQMAEDGMPVILRDESSTKSLCWDPVLMKDDALLAEFGTAPPALNKILEEMGEEPGADAVVHTNGRFRRPTIHLDVHPYVQPVMNALGYNPFTIVCSCRGERHAKIISKTCSAEIAQTADLVRKEQIHYVKEADNEQVLESTNHWDVTLHEGDCLVFSPYTNYHQFSTTEGSIGQSTRPLGHSKIAGAWFWEGLFHYAAGLKDIGADGRRVFSFNIKGFATNAAQKDAVH